MKWNFFRIVQFRLYSVIVGFIVKSAVVDYDGWRGISHILCCCCRFVLSIKTADKTEKNSSFLIIVCIFGSWNLNHSNTHFFRVFVLEIRQFVIIRNWRQRVKINQRRQQFVKSQHFVKSSIFAKKIYNFSSRCR